MIVVMGEQQIQDLQQKDHEIASTRYQPTSSLFLHELDSFLQSHQGQWTSSNESISQPVELKQPQHVEITISSQHIHQFNQFMTKHGYHWTALSTSHNSSIQKISLQIEYMD